MDATDTPVPENCSRGRSQTVLYNTERPHGSLGYKPPAPKRAANVPCYALAPSMETVVDTDPDSDEAIKAKIAECQTFLEALESGNLHIGAPFEGRTEARIDDLKRKIAMYQSILDKRQAPEPNGESRRRP
jgi:hypothetical protein